MTRTRISSPRSAAGFTLIELMIVVAVIGILAAIAYPSYREAVLKGRRAEGRTALSELLQQQERYMTQRGSYLEFALDAAGVPFRTWSGDKAAGASYKLRADRCGAQPISECVQLSAVPQQPDARAGTLIIDSTGARDCSGSDKSVCWK